MALASFVPVKSHTLRVGRYLVKAGETIAVGDPVAIDANGLLTVASAASTTLAGVAAGPITSAASGDTLGVYDDPKQIYRAKCDNVAENLQATKGDTVDLIGSTGAFYVNLGASATNVFRVVDIGPFVDPLLAASANDFFSINDGTVVYVEIAAHEFAS